MGSKVCLRVIHYCSRLDVVYPGRAWSSSPAYTWHCSWHYFLSPCNSLVSSWCDHSMLASLLWQLVSNSSLFTPVFLRTHSLVFFAVHKTCRIFIGPSISKASRRVSSFFLSVQLSQLYVSTGHTSAFISLIFIEISMLWLFHIFCSDAPTACLSLVTCQSTNNRFFICLQCFDAVGWAAGRASGL